MENDEDLKEQEELELWEEKAKKEKPKKQMKVSGKSVFTLRDQIKKKAEEVSKESPTSPPRADSRGKGGDEGADTDSAVDA